MYVSRYTKYRLIIFFVNIYIYPNISLSRKHTHRDTTEYKLLYNVCEANFIYYYYYYISNFEYVLLSTIKEYRILAYIYFSIKVLILFDFYLNSK